MADEAFDVFAVLNSLNGNTSNLKLDAAVKRSYQAIAELVATQRDTLRMLEAAHREIGMWDGENKRVLRAKAALAFFPRVPA